MTMILDSTIQSAAEYLKLKKQQQQQGTSNENGLKKKHTYLVPERPTMCPDCQAKNSFWVKAYYFRWFVEGDIEDVLPVPRYICRWCHLVISILFAFLVPYRQFTKQVIAEGVEQYILIETTYRKSAGMICGDDDSNQRPDHSQVWRWVNIFAGRAAWKLNLVLQRLCVRAGKTEHLAGVHNNVCPNMLKAQSLEKVRKLNSGTRLLALAKLLFELEDNFVATLQTYFVNFVHPPLSMLTGRGVKLCTPHSLQHMIF
jgi:hypothetical protein